MSTIKRTFPEIKLAVLHQAAPVPAVGGVVKPMKPGGYKDSSADIAYNLRPLITLILPSSSSASPTPMPTPEDDDLAWSFPDTPAGLSSALAKGANVIWCNTTLHAEHAVIDLKGKSKSDDLRFVGQNPFSTQKIEDKATTNSLLSSALPHVPFPESWTLPNTPEGRKTLEEDIGKKVIEQEGGMVVTKPVRGRGSYGVRRCGTLEELREGAEGLWSEGDLILVERYLTGEEITVTVLPPGEYDVPIGKSEGYAALPVVTRFGHTDGIAPYNGVTPVTANSRAISPTSSEHQSDPAYSAVQRACEEVAKAIGAWAPIRVDCRRRSGEKGEFVLFDVNPKPNATGPGRPGRDNQASLTTMAAEAIGWDYPTLLLNVVRNAKEIDAIEEVDSAVR